MLQVMRNSVGSWTAKIILLLLVGAFAMWGVPTDFSFSSQAVIEAGGQEVRPAEFDQMYRAQVNQLRQQGVDPEIIPREMIANQVIGQLQNRILFEAEASALGVTTSDEILRRDTHELESFQNPDGVFSRDIFQSVLFRAGLNENQYFHTRKRELVVSTLVDAIDSSAQAPAPLASALFEYLRETRDISYVRLPINDKAELAPATEDSINAFYDERKEAFRAPEYRTLTYVEIAPSKLAESLEPSAERIQEAYDQRMAQFTSPERRTVLQMLLPDEETARKAHEALSQGKSFEDVAAEFAGMTASDINLGTMTRSELPDETLAESTFSLSPNTFSEPGEGLFGWYIVQVTGIEAETIQSLADVSGMLKRELAREEANQLAYDLSQDFDDKIGAGATLEEAAAALNLEARKVEALDRDGNDKSGKTITGLPGGDSFYRFAFETEEGLDSFMQENGDDGFFILRVDQVEASRIKSLDEVRDDVVALWEADARRKQTEEAADKLVGQLNDGSGRSLAEQAAQMELEVLTAAGLNRLTENNASGLPAPLVSELFDIETGKAASAYAGDGYVVAVVDEVKVPDVTVNADAVASLQNNIANGMRNDLLAQYVAALRNKHDLSVNHTLINQLLSQQ